MEKGLATTRTKGKTLESTTTKETEQERQPQENGAYLRHPDDARVVQENGVIVMTGRGPHVSIKKPMRAT
jgi:hypothetical protein